MFYGDTCVSRISPFSANHVDILGNQDVLRDVLLIAAGQAEQLGDKISSKIDSIVANMAL